MFSTLSSLASKKRHYVGLPESGHASCKSGPYWLCSLTVSMMYRAPETATNVQEVDTEIALGSNFWHYIILHLGTVDRRAGELGAGSKVQYRLACGVRM